jgi:hypothetical protein
MVDQAKIELLWKGVVRVDLWDGDPAAGRPASPAPIAYDRQ